MNASSSPTVRTDLALKVEAASVYISPENSLATSPTSTSPNDDYGARPAVFKSTFQEVLFVLVATMAIGTNSMSAGSVTVITSFVGRELNMSTAQITWISASTSLAGGSFLLLFARIADLFGRRWMFVGSLFLFSIFALGAGFATSPLTLDVLTGFMGLMSAAAVPPAQGMLAVIYDTPSKRKNAAFACFSAGNPLGFVFGMIASGIATQVLGWRASFWWLALVYVCFAAIAFFIVPNDTRDKEKLGWNVLKKFDILGVIFTIAGTGMFSAALTLGSDAPQGWRTGYVLALLIVGLTCLVAFVFWELWVAYPLIPMSIFRDRNFSLVSLFNFFLHPSMLTCN
jgi:MFS family permease